MVVTGRFQQQRTIRHVIKIDTPLDIGIKPIVVRTVDSRIAIAVVIVLRDRCLGRWECWGDAIVAGSTLLPRIHRIHDSLQYRLDVSGESYCRRNR
jgi:hypothetical protein